MSEPRVIVRWIPRTGRGQPPEPVTLALNQAVALAKRLTKGRTAQFNFRQRAGTLSLEIFNHDEAGGPRRRM
jgi:hypothetical protein